MCPCHSGDEYNECCKPFHEGVKLPAYPVQLMRSRYSGYAMNLGDYIIKTTHPENPHYQKDLIKWKKEIELFSKQTKFEQLEILEADGDYVTFKAGLFSLKGEDLSFIEKSEFRKLNGKWLYFNRIS